MAFGFAASAQGIKFGHINSQEILHLTPERDSAIVKLQAYEADLTETMQGMQDEFQAKYTEYERKANEWAPVVRESKEKELQELNNRMMQFQQSAQQEMQQMQQPQMGMPQAQMNAAMGQPQPLSKIDVPPDRGRPQSLGTMSLYQNLSAQNRGDGTEAGIARLLPRLFSSVPFPRFLLRRLIRGRATTAPRHRRTITGEKKRPLSDFRGGLRMPMQKYEERRANVLRLTSASVSSTRKFLRFYGRLLCSVMSCPLRIRLRASQENTLYFTKISCLPIVGEI